MKNEPPKVFGNTTPQSKGREILIEYVQIGHSYRVTAVDADSGTEVVFQAPVNTSRKEMERIAVSKMKYVLNKKDEG
jgi:hypothetical protein